MLADYLSRLEMDATAAIPNNMPDATILMITPISNGEDPDSWLQEIEHYLLTGMVSPRIEGEARKKLALRCWWMALYTTPPRTASYVGS